MIYAIFFRIYFSRVHHLKPNHFQTRILVSEENVEVHQEIEIVLKTVRRIAIKVVILAAVKDIENAIIDETIINTKANIGSKHINFEKHFFKFNFMIFLGTNEKALNMIISIAIMIGGIRKETETEIMIEEIVRRATIKIRRGKELVKKDQCPRIKSANQNFH